MLRPVRSLPPSTRSMDHEPYVAADVREFARGRMDVCAVEFEGRRPGNVANALKGYLKKHPVPGVSCVVRSGTPYLVREVRR